MLRARPLTTAGIVVAAILGIPFLLRAQSEWQIVYVGAARDLVAGSDIYGGPGGYAYPPLMALLAVPFAALPRALSLAAWYGVTCGSAAYLLRMAWRLSGGGRLEGDRLCRQEVLICGLGLAASLRYVLSAAAHQQTDILIAALALAGCATLSGGTSLAAPVRFGLAAALKGPALLWAPVVAWARGTRAALWVVLVAVSVNLLPDVIVPPPGGELRLARWYRLYLEPVATGARPPGVWASDPLYNQSIAGLVARLGAPAEAVTATTAVLLAVLIVGAVVATVLSSRSRSEADEEVPSRNVLVYGVVICLTPLISPMAGKAHFAALVLPAFCVARAGVAGGRPLARVAIVAAILTCLPAEDLLGDRVAFWALWYGAPAWNALALLIGCSGALVRERHPHGEQRPLERLPGDPVYQRRHNRPHQ
jgi:hypothetical protein